MDNGFLAGFGMTDITPLDSVPMASYGDDLNRFSEGQLTPLEARALAITDENGESMIFVVGDLSWAPGFLGGAIKENLEKELGIPADHVVLSGIHTHNSVSAHQHHLPEIVRYQKRYIEGMTEAAKLAYADRKPADLYIGSAATERLNFVRRYFMDDGSLAGDNTYGTGTRNVVHETPADNQLQLMKFVRQGGKDILIGNFQCHPHLEGKLKLLSSQVCGVFRDAVESRLGAHCIYWNGAAGNINSHSRIKSEMRTKDRLEWGNFLCDYAEQIYNTMTPVKTGPIRVASVTCEAKVNHQYDGLVDKAQEIYKYFKEGHTATEAAEFAHQFGINSYYHANRIIQNSKEPESKNVYLFAFSFGDVSGIVLPYEMFDTNGMYIKSNTPFAMTFIVGYSYPAYTGYIPSAIAWEHGGYECDNCNFVAGTAEVLADQYLELLKKIYK